MILSWDVCQDGTTTQGEGEVHGVVAGRLAAHLGWVSPANYLIGGHLAEGEWVFVLSNSNVIAPKYEVS